MDNLNTHRMSSLYEAFPPAEARRLSAMERQAIGGRVADQPTLRKCAATWESDRNGKFNRIDWQFRTDDARIKLRRLYPQISAT